MLYAFLLGVAYAAFRLWTNSIWPLMALHACSDVACNDVACNDVAIDLSLFATVKRAGRVASTAAGCLIASEFVLIGVSLALAISGLWAPGCLCCEQ